MLIQSRSNGDTEAGALMFVFYFDKVAYQLAMLELMRFVCVFVNMIMFVKKFNLFLMLNVQYIQLIKNVCVCTPARDHFNCFFILAESTLLNTYCLINNHWIKVCFYLCTLTMKTKQILYIT